VAAEAIGRFEYGDLMIALKRPRRPEP